MMRSHLHPDGDSSSTIQHHYHALSSGDHNHHNDDDNSSTGTNTSLWDQLNDEQSREVQQHQSRFQTTITDK